MTSRTSYERSLKETWRNTLALITDDRHRLSPAGIHFPNIARYRRPYSEGPRPRAQPAPRREPGQAARRLLPPRGALGRQELDAK